MRNGPKSKPEIEPYKGPSGGYGSLKSVAEVLMREGLSLEIESLSVQNKPAGFICVSCAWGKPAHPHPAEFCENGAKATAWELTRRRVDPAFFEKHTLAELETWLDYDLEEAGRLTQPMRWDRDTDRYVPVAWAEAFEEIGRGAYFPEANPLAPLRRHDKKANTPAYKAIPVTIAPSASQMRDRPE